MAQENYNVSLPNDGLGDELRAAFLKQQAMNTELYSSKVDKVAGKSLSDNNFTDEQVQKLALLDPQANKNVQPNWNELDPTSDAYILGKPVFAINQILVSAIWAGVGFEFNVTADAFPLDGVTYPAEPNTIILEPANPLLDRIDLIVAIKPENGLTVGTVGKITGMPADSGLIVPPDYDPSKYYVIKQITVIADSDSPENTENTPIYADSTNWTKELSANAVENSSEPSEGVNCIESNNWSDSDYLIFTAPEILSTDVLDLLQFDIKLKSSVFRMFIQLSIYKDGVKKQSFLIGNAVGGFDSGDLAYQTVSIDKQLLNFNIQDFDAIGIKTFGAPSGFYFDNFTLFKGSGSETLPNTGIQDAPIDDGLYARKNGAWQKLSVDSDKLPQTIATQGQTAILIPAGSDNIDIYIKRVYQLEGIDYTPTPTGATMTYPLDEGDIITVRTFTNN